jgi:hypothetical protein
LNVSAATFLANSGGGEESVPDGVSKKSPLWIMISGFSSYQDLLFYL